MNTWDDFDTAVLADYLFETNLSRREIAQEMQRTELDVTQHIKELGLSWVKRNGHNMSRGQAALTTIMRKLLPGAKIVNEEHIGERLKLDIYCPSYKLAVEYHGRQHFSFVKYFHSNMDGFYESQQRDERKIEICEALGITLVVFRFNDKLDESSVYERLLDGLRNSPVLEPEKKKSIKGDPYYEAWKQRQREYRKTTYKKMKQRG